MGPTVTGEEIQIRDWGGAFFTPGRMPPEAQALERERNGEHGVTADQVQGLRDKARQSGFFGIQTPEEYGGMGLGGVMNALIETELGRTFVPFAFAGDADNILFEANEEQKKA